MLHLMHFDDMDSVVTEGLRETGGVIRTKTLLASHTYSPKLLEQGFGIGAEGK